MHRTCCYHHGLRSGIVFQRIRKRKATSFGICSELCDGGRGSYMKGHSVKAASLQFPRPERTFSFSLFIYSQGKEWAAAACQWPDRCRCVATGIYRPSHSLDLRTLVFDRSQSMWIEFTPFLHSTPSACVVVSFPKTHQRAAGIWLRKERVLQGRVQSS